MIGELLKVGDKVTITIPKENREWGYNPCPDGTVATFVSFTEIPYGRTCTYGREPGIYENTSWANLSMPDGSTHRELAFRLALVDKEEEKRREEEFMKLDIAARFNRKKLRPLPELPFYEGDMISCEKVPEAKVVCHIDYSYLHTTRTDGSPFPIYNISNSSAGGWTTAVAEGDLKLVKRGKIWEYYHGVKPVFDTLEEEANFYHMIGLDDEVRNPATKVYSWTEQEALDALRNGLGHSIMAGSRTSVWKFRDAEFGKRVAETTLAGWNK